MARYERERPDAGYYIGLADEGTPPIWEVLKNIDEKTKKALSATGGTYNPTDPIIIGGEGIELQTRCAFGANSVLYPALEKRFIFGDDDYFRYPTDDPLERTVTVHAYSGVSAGFLPGSWTVNSATSLNTAKVVASTRPRALFHLPVRVHNGARIFQLVFVYASSGSAPADVPAELPKGRLIKIARDGTITPFGVDTTQSIGEPGGWVREAQPVDATAYHAGGAAKAVTMYLDASDETGHVIDTSEYSYAFEFVAEGGANARTNGNNHFHGLTISLRIPDLRPQ